jgi:hypothetical protein
MNDEMIETHKRRLALLKHRAAIEGLKCDPAVLIEIESIEEILTSQGIIFSNKTKSVRSTRNSSNKKDYSGSVLGLIPITLMIPAGVFYLFSAVHNKNGDIAFFVACFLGFLSSCLISKIHGVKLAVAIIAMIALIGVIFRSAVVPYSGVIYSLSISFVYFSMIMIISIPIYELIGWLLSLIARVNNTR